MVYADYEFYTNEYMGAAIEEVAFPRLALRSSQYIDYITQGRAETNAEVNAVKMCCCELAEQYQYIEFAQSIALNGFTTESAGGEIQSESVGSWSRSYRSGGDTAASAFDIIKRTEAGLYTIAQRYLANTGLLYRGRRCPC